jgi:hypothetical protein
VSVSRLSTNGSSFQTHRIPTCRNHQRMQFLCLNLSKPKSLSTRASGKPMICQEQMINLLMATHGRSSRQRFYVAIPSKSKLTSKRRTKSGFTWAKNPLRQGHNLPRILRSQDIIQGVTSSILFLSQSLLLHDNRMQPHIHQQSISML